MRFGFTGGRRRLRQIVRQRASSYDVVRPNNESSSRFGETGTTDTTISGVQLWLTQPSESLVESEYGDRLDGDLLGYSLPSTDIQQNDEVTHGADTYEVADVMHIPDNDNKSVKIFSLDKKVNEGSR